jgi:hypothetical protein
MSNESKLQLDSSVGTYLDQYLEVQSTQGGCDEICTRVRVDLVPSQPRLRAGSGSRPGIGCLAIALLFSSTVIYITHLSRRQDRPKLDQLLLWKKQRSNSSKLA